MREHILKCHPQFMPRIASGQKTFEIRNNDRDYQVGDILILEEFNPDTSVQWQRANRHPMIEVRVVYMSSIFQQDNYVVLGIELTNKPNSKE